MGFVPKRASNEMLFEALHMVMSGGLYVPPLLARQASPQPGLSEPSRSAMLDEVVGSDTPATSVHQAARMPASSMRDDARAAQALFDTLGLTPRQLEVLRLLLQGQPNKLIARELGLSVETIKDHVAAVLRALGVNSRTQAVLAVNQMLQREARNPAPPEARNGQDGSA
jgi:DNA-binding NarL/FixJ family response regulator